MRYLPHTPEEIDQMLAAIGIKNLKDLYVGVPQQFQIEENLALPESLTEQHLREHLNDIASQNITLGEGKSFLGAGSYYHYVPSLIRYLVKRGEFLTAYTPYQPEVSQGTLQAVFEYQTMVSELTGLPVANASNYDLSTACAEAILMAQRVNEKKTYMVSQATHPHYRMVMQTCLRNLGHHCIEIPCTSTGETDFEFLKQHFSPDVGAVLLQSPNFFGVIENLKQVGDYLQDKDALFIAANPEPISYAVLTSPAEAGADIAIAEGMSFGLGLNYGGPYLGLFAVKEKYLRNMPGRIVGQTTDKDGKRGYVLTFSTREQHIRREKATSNICTNQGLCALMASIYLSLMGPNGLKNLALINMQRLQHLENSLKKINPKCIEFSGVKFNELVVKLTVPAKDAVVNLLEEGFFPGIDLSTYYPHLNRHLLICTTEMNSLDDIDLLVESLTPFLGK